MTSLSQTVLTLLHGREIRLASFIGNVAKVCEVEKGILHKQKLDTETMVERQQTVFFLVYNSKHDEIPFIQPLQNGHGNNKPSCSNEHMRTELNCYKTRMRKQTPGAHSALFWHFSLARESTAVDFLRASFISPYLSSCFSLRVYIESTCRSVTFHFSVSSSWSHLQRSRSRTGRCTRRMCLHTVRGGCSGGNLSHTHLHLWGTHEVVENWGETGRGCVHEEFYAGRCIRRRIY